MRTFDLLDNQSEQSPISERQNGASFLLESAAKPGKASSDKLPRELVYDLRIDEQSSEHFYAEVAAFSERVVAEIERRAGPALDGYSRYVTTSLREAPRSRGEYALELLTVGMAIRLYGRVAASSPGWVIDLARGLFAARRRSPSLKPLADFLRAGLFQLFIRRKLDRPPGESAHHPERPGGEIACSRLPRLIEWMQATGEFEQEWRRVDNFRSYWSQLPLNDAENWMAVSVALFDWFTSAADDALGRYTAGVIHFLETTYAARFWREDQIFCGRLPVEYHLGMVAAEVMNEGLRENFRSRPRKVVLVPGCMRGARTETCQAVIDGLDIRCRGCDPECAINRITRRMLDQGSEVYIVPHSTGFSRWLERWQNDPTVGVAARGWLE